MAQEIEHIQTQNQIVNGGAPHSRTFLDMVGRAMELGLSSDIIKNMMDVRDRDEARFARKAFDEAFALAKSEIKPIIRNAVGHNNKRYADFAAIADVVDPIISKFGLSYRFKTTQTDRIHVTCILAHDSGHYEETTLAGPPDASGSKNAIQAIGSTLTYLQRYSLMQALGLAASNDDDGKASGQNDEPKFITDEQVKTIWSLIEESKSDIKQFCLVQGVESVPQIKSHAFETAVRILEQRKAALAKKIAGGAA